MRTSAPALLPLFRSGTQLAILGTLYVGPDRCWTITALAEHVDQPVSTVAREIGRLDDAGIVTVTAEGRNKLVGPNWELPWALALSSLLDQTVGPLALLSEALGLLEGIEEAFIFGSWAERYQGARGSAPRDIDLLVIGDHLSRFAVVDATNAVADRAGVEVNSYLASIDEWNAPEPDSFLADVQTKSLVPVPLRAGSRA